MPQRHSYPLPIIFLSLRWEINSCLHFRGTSSAMQVLVEEGKIDYAPSHETCIQWDLKLGLYKLQRKKDTSTQWTWIVDHVIGEGTIKCLAVIGVSHKTLSQKAEWSLSLEDLEPFGLIPMVRSTGQNVLDALNAIANSTGIRPRSIVSDHGSDLWSGVKQFCNESGASTIEQYDVCHKVAIEFKKLLDNDPDWKKFSESATHAKRQLFNTDGVCYAPPNQRRKGRYQNIDILIGWANRILNCEEAIPLKILDKLRWVFEFRHQITIWSQWILIGQITKNEIRTKGFSENMKNNLFTKFQSLEILKSSEELISSLTDYVVFETGKLLPEEKSLGSSEMIESLFGHFKRVKCGVSDQHGGLGRLILTAASRVGELTMDVTKTALELIKVSDVNRWISTSFNRGCYAC